MFIIKAQDGMRRTVYSGTIDVWETEWGKYVVSVRHHKIAEFETYAEADTLIDELEKKLYEHIHHGDMWEKVDLCERRIEKAITDAHEKMAVGHRDKENVLVLPKELDDDWGVETVIGVEKETIDISNTHVTNNGMMTDEQVDKLVGRIIKRYDERTAAQVSKGKHNTSITNEQMKVLQRLKKAKSQHNMR